MARPHKPVQLRPVEDTPPPPVVRLENDETAWRETSQPAVRLGPPAEPSGVSHRLDLPDREDHELRTHQPGIEAIIETEPAAPDLLETGWGEDEQRRKPVPWGWFVLIGLLVGGAVVWSLTRVTNADEQAEQIRERTESALVREQQAQREAQQLVERIHQRLGEFFATTEPAKLEHLIRQPERVVPSMRRFYQKQPLVASALTRVKALRPLDLGNQADFWLASVSLANDESHQLVLEVTTDGAPLIDWETLVCYQPMPWDDFVSQRPRDTPLDFRVYAEPDNFYNHEFADSNRWLCFRLTALKSEEPLYGYVAKDSPLAKSLVRQIQLNRGRRTALLLRLSIPAGLQSQRGVIIDEMLSNRWVYTAPDTKS